MSDPGSGYAVIDLPAPSQQVIDEFEHLPFDPFTGGQQRYRRFSQFRMWFDEAAASWRLERLPHRPFLQPKVVNGLIGGIQRPFEPLRFDPTPQIAAGARALNLDRGSDWQLNVHQCRVMTNPDVRGISVPEGPHRDGHEYGMLAVFSRRTSRAASIS